MRLVTAILGLLALPLAASAQNEIYTSVLSGANEVPPNGSPATGSVTLTVNPGTLEWTLSGAYSGMTSNVTASHIHTGAAGVNGGVLFTLTNTGGQAGTLSGAGTFSPTQLSTLRTGGLYVNVHTTTFPGGELRDQLRRALPTVDGSCADISYTTLATSTSGNNGFGDSNDLGALRVFADGTDLYVCLTGDLEGNGNGYAVFINANGYDGVDAGLALPAGGPGFFTAIGGTVLDLEADYAFFVNRSGTTSYIDGVRYGSNSVLGGAYGGAVNDNTSSSVDAAALFGGSGTGTGTQAFMTGYDAGTAPNNGYEIRIPLSSMPGVVSADSASFFVAIAGNGGYFSNELLPDEGYDGTADGAGNFGNDPNFDAAATGNPLFTSPAIPLPVELSSLTAVADGDAAVVRWTTESETNNAGFDLQTLRSGAWTTVASATGRGTTSERTRYEQRVDGLVAGRHTFRLVQRDLDGTATIAGTVELVIGSASALMAEARGASVRFGAAAAQPLTVEAFDVLGRRVATLFAGAVEAGSVQSAELTGVAPGVYVVRVAGRTGFASTTLVVR